MVFYAHQISSMIEIEVEMDSDVLAAEAASNAVSSKSICIVSAFSKHM